MTKKSANTSLGNLILNNNWQYKLWISRLILLLIVLFAIFLRYEDFSIWQQNKTYFQYQGEYQMANFDSYYYLQIAKELQEGSYDNLEENRYVPNGMKTPFIPPLISILATTISSLFNVPLSTIAIFLPIFLASLLAPLVFIFGRKLHFNRITALTAALFSILSLTYVVRTRIGVFDTDCLNVVFILLNSYLFFRFAELKTTQRYTYLALGFLSSFLFAIWWNTATSVVVLSSIISFSIAFIFFFKTEKIFLKYGVFSLIVLISAYFTGDQLLSYFNLLFSKTNSVFPNNMSVTELDSVNLDTFIKKTSNNAFIFTCMIFGIIALCWKLKLKALFFAIPIALALAPFLAGNRFMIFSAPILGLGIGYFLQMLFNFKKVIKPKIAYTFTIVIIIVGVSSNYNNITDKYEKPAAIENVILLNAIEKNTPEKSNIWTNWDLGYQIQYYLDRGTYADGEFIDGEMYYYASFPLAASNLAVSANFMRFYNKRGVEGMSTLYESLSGVARTFKFLNIILALSPSKAEQWLITKQKDDLLPKTKTLTTPRQWVAFLFPEQSDDIYLFLHHKMTQTASWFKQGNSDLKTGKTKGLPLFLSLNGLKEQGNQIKNNQISLDTNTGIANYLNQKRYFQSLSSFSGIETKTKSFSESKERDNRFVFQWNKKIGFGAAMSKEMANTTLVKLYLLQEKSPHFESIAINTPRYQIWKITGNAYNTETSKNK